jgi:hypothetical protein
MGVLALGQKKPKQQQPYVTVSYSDLADGRSMSVNDNVIFCNFQGVAVRIIID